MSRTVTACAIAAMLITAIPAASAAQGFAVNEHGSCAMARGGAGMAAPCADGSAILFNPSGIAGMTGITVSAGVTGIKASGDFTDDLLGNSSELQNEIIPVPHAYIVYGINERLAAGLGFFVPYGLGTEWETTFEGRFNGYNNDLKSMYFQPTVAYQPHERIKIGAGLNVVVGSVKLTQRLDLSEFEAQPDITFGELGIPFHTDFANAQLKAAGATGIGGNFGITVRPTDWVSIGARYMTRVTLDYDGNVVFEPVNTDIVLPPFNPLALADPGLDETQPLPLDAVLEAADLFAADAALGDQGGDASITMPDQIVAGIAVDVTPSLKVMFDWQYINWTVFDTLKLDFENAATPDRTIVENYKATHGLRFGFDLAASENLAVRGGYLYHAGAAPPETVTPLLPEGTRSEVTIGFGYQAHDRFRFDLAYQYLKQNDRRGRVREPAPGQAPTIDLNTGVYSFFAHLFGATLTVNF